MLIVIPAQADDAAVISHKLLNTTMRQGAPAIVTRGGLPMPTVHALASEHCSGVTYPTDDGQQQRSENYCQPFVIATRFPNGPTMVSAIGRTRHGNTD